MENFMEQTRVKFTGEEPKNKGDVGGSRVQKIPIQGSQSFKVKKKGQNWFQRLFVRKMSRDYDDDSREMEHATAVAAAAFAVSSQEVSEIPQQKKTGEASEASLSRSKSKGEGTKSPFSQLGGSKRFSGSFKSSDGQGKKEPTSARDEKKPETAITPVPSTRNTLRNHLKNILDTEPDPTAPKKTPSLGDTNLKNTDDIKPEAPAPKIPPPGQSTSLRPPPPPPIREPSTRLATGETEADAWEKAELEKIKQRYEKLKETIDSWETKKIKKARRKLDNQQSEMEKRRIKSLDKFRSNMQYVDQIARGAREQADIRRRNEELKVEEKANKIRTTGKLPEACSCF